MNFLATLKKSVFLFLFLFLSCQNPKNKQSIVLILEEMQALANTENKPVFAEIERNDKKGYTAKNIEFLTDFVIGFVEGFSGENKAMKSLYRVKMKPISTVRERKIFITTVSKKPWCNVLIAEQQRPLSFNPDKWNYKTFMSPF